MQAINSRILSTLFSIIACQAYFADSACAASVGLSDVPVYVKQGVEPNIFFTLDDSGSMVWSHVPDAIVDTYDTKRAKSSTFNKMYYDPKITYTPAVDASGASLGDSSFTNAWNDGFNQSGTGACTVNLSTSYRPTWGGDVFDNCNDIDENGEWSGPEYAGPAEPAYYYKFDESGDGNINDDAHYTKVVVTAAEQQNFANWYSYYRTRMLTAKTAVSRSFARLGPVFRISRQSINDQANLTPLSEFSKATRKDFFAWLSGVYGENGTPLRTALRNVGSLLEDSAVPYRDDPNDATTARSCRQNFHIMMTDGEWNGDNPNIGNLDAKEQTLPTNKAGITNYKPSAPFEDSNTAYLADLAFYYWYTDLRDDLDNDVPVSITKTICKTKNGDCSNTNAVVDTAKTFWHPENDPATWQHLVNYTIGFGVSGDITYPSDYDTLLDGTTKWGDNHVDDLWHASLNSRGRYLSALNAQDLVDSFTGALNNVLSRSSTTAPATLNSGSVNSETKLFQVSFNTLDWTGKLFSKPISDGSSNTSTCTSDDAIGDVCSPEWEASCKLNGGLCKETGKTEIGLNWNTGRKIITYNPATAAGIPFRWTSLNSDITSNADQQDLLNGTDGRGEDRLHYIRGSKTYEASNFSNSCTDCTFRSRYSLLGDMINSNPTYVGAPTRIYPDSLEAARHSTFRTAQKDRPGTVYVGSNDGMLHAFASATGTELLAYVPNMVFPKLASLTDENYSHTNFVDGQLDEGDVYYNSAWHTALVGGLGYGGQGIFALDITDPSRFSEQNAANIVLWEYSDANDDDLGYTYGKPVIRKLNNGKWAAIFGNGYDSTADDDHVSTTGYAAIYIVDISDGSLIKKISTKVGTAEDPTGASRANAITGIQPIDINNDFKIDYLYAGDLFGNVWRFDLAGNSKDTWKLAFSGKPLYKARDSANNAQPITTITAVGHHTSYMGTIVYFGTGKYLGDNDLTDTSQQTFYGIWDRWFDNDDDTAHNEDNFKAFTRTNLLQQEIIGSTRFSNDGTVDARVTTNNMIDWDTKQGWYLDLTESGERVFQSPILRNNRIIFVTATLSTDPCSGGGTSWLMELDAISGSRLDTSPFDYNGDGSVDAINDMVTLDTNNDGSTDEFAGSGIRLDIKDGIYTTPAVLTLPSSGKERKYMATSSSHIKGVDEDPNTRLKQSWREIMECGI
jgi:type IV pilus assembly protein PilY1